MFSKSKYDVMESETSKCSVSLLLLVGKVYKDLKAYEKEKMDKEHFNAGFVSAIGKGLPSIKSLAHIGYENSCDLAKVNEVSLYKYMKENGLSREEFRANYANAINTYIKILLAFIVIDKENLNVYKIITPETMLGLVRGEFSGLKEIISSLDVELSSDSKALVDKLVEKDFSIKSLSSEEKSLLDKEHTIYMKKNITSKVTKPTEEVEVVKYAKSIGKKKSVLEI